MILKVLIELDKKYKNEYLNGKISHLDFIRCSLYLASKYEDYVIFEKKEKYLSRFIIEGTIDCDDPINQLKKILSN
ncbi:hypothetical protein GNY06_04145 [Elizabethkingia argentiflava]|uniref:Uncharacterized protein n=1 Tax=Elizabethkingia argenteiflava TaxID=2681556 RepID=A0A845PWB5_9FLAO|nr:hypothetical protein [Elizabethkingia argenteiflava]NAW50608.1 hypothetical protein [Elizabethkingia argenteiflava]